MGEKAKLPLAIVGGFIVLYCIAVLGYVSTSPDLRLRFLISDELESPALEQGIPIRSTTGLKCYGELPRNGDVILRIGENRIRTFLDFTSQMSSLRNASIPPGGQLYENTDPSELSDSLPAIVEHPNGQRWVNIEFDRLNSDGTTDRFTSSYLQVQSVPLEQVSLTLVWFVLQLSIFAVAALAFWNRPFDRASRIFFAMCIITLGAFVGGFHWSIIASTPWLNVPFIISAVLAPAVLLHFFLVFPRPQEPLTHSPLLTLCGLYLIPILAMGRILTLLGYAHWLQLSEVSDAHIASALETLQSLRVTIYIYVALAALYFGVALFALRNSYQSSRNPMERRQLTWLWRAGQVASCFIGVSLVLALFWRVEFALGAARIPMFLASLSFMLAYTVGILRYRLMFVDQIVSKGAMYYVFTSGLTIAFSLVVGLSTLLPQFLNISPSPQQALMVAAVLMLGVMSLLWLRDRFQQTIDRQFFREKYQLDKALQQMNLAVSHLAAPETLAEMMLGSCKEVLQVEQAALYLRTSPTGPLQLIAVDGTEDVPLHFYPQQEFRDALQQSGSLQRVIAGSRSEMTSTQNSLRILKADLVHALVSENNLTGLVALGKKSNSSPFTAEDLTFLNALGQITNVAFHSAKVDRDISRLNDELQLKLEKITTQQRQIAILQTELSGTHDDSESSSRNTAAPGSFNRDPIKGNSPAMQRVLETVRKVAESEASVLIRGESGTGKELLAQILHNNSPRNSGPLVRVHCAALSAGLLESELFGHVKGAFTGAHRDKVGRFEMAHGGTLFLDEIGDISLETQIKLLRVLQERCFEPVGGTDTIHVDVRLITATHQNLEKLIEDGKFRKDLFYRLNVISIPVPPLRDRREDVLELAISFLNRSASRLGKRVTHFDDDALYALEQYNWPGNVRELENVLERAVVLVEGDMITPQDLPDELLQPAPGISEQHAIQLTHPPRLASSRPEVSLSETSSLQQPDLEKTERDLLENALRQTNGNKAQAARILNMPRSTYYSKLKKHNIS